jgi:hypothetical protein
MLEVGASGSIAMRSARSRYAGSAARSVSALSPQDAAPRAPPRCTTVDEQSAPSAPNRSKRSS